MAAELGFEPRQTESEPIKWLPNFHVYVKTVAIPHYFKIFLNNSLEWLMVGIADYFPLK